MQKNNLLVIILRNEAVSLGISREECVSWRRLDGFFFPFVNGSVFYFSCGIIVLLFYGEGPKSQTFFALARFGARPTILNQCIVVSVQKGGKTRDEPDGIPKLPKENSVARSFSRLE